MSNGNVKIALLPASRVSAFLSNRTVILAFLACVAIFYFWCADARLPYLLSQNEAPFGFYNAMTDAFLSGHASLNIAPDPHLLALPNPYLPSANFNYRLHDALLYNKKYYLYWGISPAILLFIPVHVLTHKYLTDIAATMIFALGALVFYCSLINLIRNDYFGTTNRFFVFAAFIFFALGSCVPYLLRRVVVYEVAVFCGYFLVAGFLYFVYRALFREVIQQTSLIMAGLFAAFIFLDRPHEAIIVSLTLGGLALFYRKRPFSYSLAVKNLVPAFLPLAVAIVFQAAYNAARFGSPFNYGIKYQVGGMYMATYVPFSLVRFLYNSIFYTFALPVFSSSFPFVRMGAGLPSLPGIVNGIATALVSHVPDPATEPTISVFIVAPVLLFLGGLPLFLRALKGRPIASFAALIVCSALITEFVTAAFAGSTQRYELDFLPPLILVSAIVMLWAVEAAPALSLKRYLTTVVAIALFFSGLTSVALSFSGYGNLYEKQYPSQFKYLSNLFAGREQPVTSKSKIVNGMVFEDINRPECDNVGFYGKPLLTSGIVGAGDFIFLRCKAGKLAVGWDHWGAPQHLGAFFVTPHVTAWHVEIQTPAVSMATSKSAVQFVTQACRVLVNGSEVFKASPCETYTATNDQLYPLSNPLGGGTVTSDL